MRCVSTLSRRLCLDYLLSGVKERLLGFKAVFFVLN